MKTTLFSLLLLGLTIPAYSQGYDNTDVKVGKLKISGNGCPKGSYTKISTNSWPEDPTRDYFQVTYKDFTAKTGKNAEASDATRNCKIRFNIEYPKDHRVRFDVLEFYGFADLASSAVALFEASLRRGMDEPVMYKSYLHGPMAANFSSQTRRRLKEFSTDCSGKDKLTIKSLITITSSSVLENSISVDSNNGLIGQNITFKLEKCN